MDSDRERLSTDVEGLDEVLEGGLIPGRSYLLTGPAGAGKTILGFHFLTAGTARGETALFINLEEDVEDLRANAAALGFDVDAVELLDLSPGADVFTEDDTYDVFAAAEVEQEPLTDAIVDGVEAVDPDRVFVDPITQLRYLTSGEYQFRKQIVGFMRFLRDRGATVLFTAQETADRPSDDLQFICDGNVVLETAADGRQLRVPKFRGSGVRRGRHAYRIGDDGLAVFPELEPDRHDVPMTEETLPFGVPEIDDLLHGGLDRGTVSIVSGPTGAGKTTLGTQFVKEAAGRGEQSVIYLFEESERTFRRRSEAVNIPVERMIDRGTLRVEEIEALELSPQEFAGRVRRDVEADDAGIVMLDGISGYSLTLRGDEDETLQRLHALGRYLKNVGATTLLIDETSSVIGDFTATENRISYLADNIVFLRHLEIEGELRKAIGVLKKRTSDYERALREYRITTHGIRVGEPLTGLRGILTGTPEVVED